MIKTITNFGDLAVLLPLVAVVTFWLGAIRQPRALLSWFVAVGLCIGSTAALKIYFFVCPPLIDLHSPSGHTSLSTLVYGTLTLAVATVVTGWKRGAVVVSGAGFIAHGARAGDFLQEYAVRARSRRYSTSGYIAAAI